MIEKVYMTQQSIRYTIYKHPIEMDTLAIVKYLYSMDKPMLPTVIVERAWPEGLELPAIYDHRSNLLYEGIDKCAEFYELTAGEPAGLLDRARNFMNSYPGYRIN